MALDLFRIIKGLNIQSDDLSQSANILLGTGAPGGDAGSHDAATVGSIYLRTDVDTDGLQLYWKQGTANTAADWKQGTDKAYVDAVAQGLSWREPALVRDNTVYATIAAAQTAANVANTANGVTIQAGDRLLFSNLTTGNDNVYVVSGSTGAWTFTEDTNLATDGDAILIQSGTHAEQQWVFDGTTWIQFGSDLSTELAYVRAFIGKTAAGNEMPTYSSTNVVTQSGSLETAIGEADAAFGDGEITNDGGTNVLTDDMSWGAAGTLTVTGALNQLNDAVSPLVQESLETIGAQTATVLTTIDTIAVADATQVKWMVQVRATGTPANRRAVEIHAITDGTNVDHTEYAILNLGSAIAGLDFNVAISGANLILTVNSTSGVDYVVQRIAYSAF